MVNLDGTMYEALKNADVEEMKSLVSIIFNAGVLHRDTAQTSITKAIELDKTVHKYIQWTMEKYN